MKRVTWLIVLCLLFSFLFSAGAEEKEPDDSLLMRYYDGSVFFGDSRMQALRRYRDKIQQEDETFLANITLVCAESISLYSASRLTLNGEFNFSYRGRKGTLYEIAGRIHPEKIFVMIGLNDPVAQDPDKSLTYVRKVIETLKEKLPETDVYFFSETPVTANYGKVKMRPKYQEQLDVYNARMKDTCISCGGFFVDIADVFKDETGYLKREYSSDNVCHLSEEGVAVWIQALKDYAREQYELGWWDPYAEETAEEAAP